MVILNGKKEAILMGSRIDKDISKELRAGTKIMCMKCGKGVYQLEQIARPRIRFYVINAMMKFGLHQM